MISHAVSPRFKARLKILVFETCANAIVLLVDATSASTCGITFSLDFSWDDAVVVTISDASFCQEQEKIDRVTQNSKSQHYSLGSWYRAAEKMLIHLLSWSSTRIRRVCRSALMAEAYALSNAVEHGLRTGATIVDMRGQLNIRQWEETASAAMGHVSFPDCESFFSHLVSPNTKEVDN